MERMWKVSASEKTKEVVLVVFFKKYLFLKKKNQKTVGGKELW